MSEELRKMIDEGRRRLAERLEMTRRLIDHPEDATPAQVKYLAQWSAGMAEYLNKLYVSGHEFAVRETLTIDALRTALKPFADYIDRVEAVYPRQSNDNIVYVGNEWDENGEFFDPPTLGDCWRAKELLTSVFDERLKRGDDEENRRRTESPSGPVPGPANVLEALQGGDVPSGGEGHRGEHSGSLGDLPKGSVQVE